MQFAQRPQFLESSGGDAGPLQEGSADYWAAVMSSRSPDTHNEDDVCIFDWDAISYGFFFPAKPPYTVGRFCGRRADFPKTVSQAQSSSSDPHYVGQVWSTALWDIRNAIGDFTADQIYLASQFMYQANEHFNGSNGAGQALVDADQALTGGVNKTTICNEMGARGISLPNC